MYVACPDVCMYIFNLGCDSVKFSLSSGCICRRYYHNFIRKRGKCLPVSVNLAGLFQRCLGDVYRFRHHHHVSPVQPKKRCLQAIFKIYFDSGLEYAPGQGVSCSSREYVASPRPHPFHLFGCFLFSCCFKLLCLYTFIMFIPDMNRQLSALPVHRLQRTSSTFEVVGHIRS